MEETKKILNCLKFRNNLRKRGKKWTKIKIINRYSPTLFQTEYIKNIKNKNLQKVKIYGIK